jgi:hypothetical protein
LRSGMGWTTRMSIARTTCGSRWQLPLVPDAPRRMRRAASLVMFVVADVFGADAQLKQVDAVYDARRARKTRACPTRV